MSIGRVGRGRPVTVVAPGEGRGPDPAPVALARARWFADGLAGTRRLFYFEESGCPPPRRPRRQADRDAQELHLVAEATGATRALGISRGARALVGLLADDPGRFERVVLVVPPADLRTPQSYRVWLDSLPAHADGPLAAGTEILVLGHSGDRAHPQRTALDWAGRLAARVEICSLPAADLPAESAQDDRAVGGRFAAAYAHMRRTAAEFLNA